MSDSKNDDQKAEAKEVFDFYDSDGNGSINEVELALLCSSMGENLDKNKLNAVFKTLDKSGAGKIVFDDFYSWWSTESGSTGNVIASMRAKLLITKGLKYVNKLFANKQDDIKTNDHPLTLEINGAVSQPQMGISVSIDNKDTILSTAPAALALTVSLSKPESAQFVCDVFNQINQCIQDFTKGSGEISLRAVDPKDGTVKLIWESTTTVPSELEQALNMLDGFRGGVSFGWSWESLVKHRFEFKTIDLLNIEAFLTAALIPNADMMIGHLAQEVEGLLENGRRVIPFNNGIDGLDKLKSGDLSARLSTANLTGELLTFVGAQAPFPVDTVAGLLKSVPALMGQPTQQGSTAPKFALASSHLFKSLLTRDISGVTNVEVRVQGGAGFSVAILNLLDLGHFFNACVEANQVLVKEEEAAAANN